MLRSRVGMDRASWPLLAVPVVGLYQWHIASINCHKLVVNIGILTYLTVYLTDLNRSSSLAAPCGAASKIGSGEEPILYAGYIHELNIVARGMGLKNHDAWDRLGRTFKCTSYEWDNLLEGLLLCTLLTH